MLATETSDRSPEFSAFSRSFSGQRCPHCGDRMIAPEVTEFVEGGIIQHFWVCDDCGQESRSFIVSPH
jgi:uncharacterized protein with PIN domain